MSSLSVAARVKAHISTAYIDADGRGVRSLDGSGLNDTPACMLPPEEFHRRRLASQAAAASAAQPPTIPASSGATALHSEPDDTNAELARQEAAVAAVSERLDEHARTVETQECDKYRADMASVAAALISIRDRRLERHEKQKADRQSALDAAYAAQAESPEAMGKFVALSRDTADADMHRAEADAVARFVAVSQRRGLPRELSAATARDIAERNDRQRSVVAVVRDARKKAIAEEQAAEAKRQFEAELARVAENRRRQAELQRRRDEVQLQADVARAVWRQKADTLVAAEKRLADAATAKEVALHALVNRHKEAVVDGEYTALKKLQAEFQAHADDIAALLEKETKGTGSSLELVMRAARDTAKKKRCVFRGLEMLSAATMTASPYTPATRPEMENVDGKQRSLGVQVPEPEPVRGGGRRPKAADT